MAVDSSGEILVDHAFATQTQFPDAVIGLGVVRMPKIPVALSPDDLAELTTALTSYIERQALALAP